MAESAGGRTVQASGTRVPGVLDYERSLTYADGTSRLIGPKLTTTRNGQPFIVTGKEAALGTGPGARDHHGRRQADLR